MLDEALLEAKLGGGRLGSVVRRSAAIRSERARIIREAFLLR